MSRKEALILAITLFVLYFVAVAVFHGETPTATPFDASKIDYSQFSDEEIAKTKAHRDALKAKVKENVSKVTDVAVSQGSSITDIKKAGDDTKQAFDAYELANAALITAGNKAIAALPHVVAQLHRAKWLLTGIYVGFVILVVMRLPLMLKPYALYVAGGLLVTGVPAIWAFV